LSRKHNQMSNYPEDPQGQPPVTSPLDGPANFALADIIDVQTIHSLMEDFYELTKIAMAIVDLKGTVLVGVGWQEICTKFHRVHPETAHHCAESDTELTAGVLPGEFKLYKCKNNMWDVVTPIIIGGRQMGNFFSGQFFFEGEEVDFAVFRAQARKYGFNEKEYLAALEAVPRLNKKTLETGMAFFVKMANILSQQSFSNIKLGRALAELEQHIIERRSREEELQKVQRLESIGLLAGGIAHDFNNILTSILGNIFLARTNPGRDDEVRESLAQAEQAAVRAQGLARQLLTFAKGGAPIKKPVLAASLVREAVELALRGTMTRGEFQLAADLWPVEADESQLVQMISNLAINAVQAMAGGGVLKVSLANMRLGEGDEPGLSAGYYNRIEMQDQGPGIADECIGKIFDPYFTTKESGSGLGLAICYSIVKRHGGGIQVASTPGKGSVFTILLPASAERSVAPEVAVKGVMAGGGRILVMDDEESVRKVVARMLERLGYRVSLVNDGARAVAAHREALAAKEPFAAIILDLTIPAGMGGKEAARRILELDPGAKIIVSSGYDNDPVMSNHADHGFKGVIPKPFDLEELSATVGKVVAAAG
jgi:signal transduction histidine kinase/ActR/RegA family two-component response regulator